MPAISSIPPVSAFPGAGGPGAPYMLSVPYQRGSLHQKNAPHIPTQRLFHRCPAGAHTEALPQAGVSFPPVSQLYAAEERHAVLTRIAAVPK